MIRDALNKQTGVQFRQYAEQQFPGDTARVNFRYILDSLSYMNICNTGLFQ